MINTFSYWISTELTNASFDQEDLLQLDTSLRSNTISFSLFIIVLD